MIKRGDKMMKGVVRLALIVMTGMGLAGSAMAVEKVHSVTHYNYDANNRLKCSALRMNPVAYSDPTFDSLDACALSAQRGNGPDRITRNVYDATGQIIQVLQGYGTVTGGRPFIRAYATYSYSANGKVVDAIDARGNKTRNQYDALDRLEKVYYPSAGVPAYDPSTVSTARSTAGAHNANDYEAFTYDKNGNKTSWRRRDGQVISYTYDKLNRQILKDVPGGSDLDVVTAYDLFGNITSRKFATATNGIVYTYNALGWMTSSIDENLRAVSYVYNAAGARTEVVYPSMRKVVYQLDALNRIKRADLSNGQLLYTLAYNNQGQRRKLNRVNTISASESPNSCTTATDATCYGYDRLGRMKSLKHDFNNPAGSVSDVEWTFVYNPASQVTRTGASTDELSYYESNAVPETLSPRYDGLNRSTAVTSQGGTYDVRGNLTKESSSGRVYTYDIENRLLSVANAGTPTSPYVTLNYDPEGRLRTYTNTTSATTFVYDGVNPVAEYNGNTLAMETYFGPGVDEPIIGYNGSTYRLYWANYQGSIVGITSTGGTLTTGNLYKYGAYGEPRNVSNLEDWSGSRFRYTGQMALPEAKLYHYKARAYDPQMGRFLQTDPIGSDDDLNLYAYVGGDPVNGTDPTGTQVQVDWKKLGDYATGLGQGVAKAVTNTAFDMSITGHEAFGNAAGVAEVSALKAQTNAAIDSWGSNSEANAVGQGRGYSTTVAASLLTGGKTQPNVLMASKGSTVSVAAAASEVAGSIGTNRVSVMTPSGRMQIDLAGKSHFDKATRQEIPTPHVKFQELNVGPNGKSNLSPGTTRPATMDDVRTARKVIERR